MTSANRFAEFNSETGEFFPSNQPRFHTPTDLTIDQFIFRFTPHDASRPGNDGEGHFRPAREKQTWLIDSVTGRSYTSEQCDERVEKLSQSFYRHLGLRKGNVVVIYSPNDIDYPLVIWATFRAGGIISGANPTYTVQELAYQLKTLANHFVIAGLVTHPDYLQVAREAASSVHLGPEKIVLFCAQPSSNLKLQTHEKINTLDEIIDRSASQVSEPIKLNERLRPGENRKRIAFLSFSSGTTGLPKAVCISHYSVISNVIMINRHDDCDFTGQKTLALLPYYHVFGLVVVLHAGIYRNLTNVVIPKFEFQSYTNCVVKYKPSVLYLVPPIILLLTKSDMKEEKLAAINDSVETIWSGAAPLTDEVISSFEKRFPKVRINQAYGMTETSTQVTGFPNLKNYRGLNVPRSSVGILCPNVSIKIVPSGGEKDEKNTNKPVQNNSNAKRYSKSAHSSNKNFLGFNQLGEITIKSSSNAMGYLGNPKATSETFGSDGYLRTGDQGYIDEYGWVYVVDRLKELIKVKGNQVAPAELEGHLLGNQSVKDVCVIGIQDEYSGELPRAYVVRNELGLKIEPSKLREELKKFVADHKARYKWLDGGIEFVDLIPKNASGKILRKEIREKFKKEQKRKPGAKL